MLDVAVEQIAREGMSVGLDSIRLEEVIEAAGVSRASAYRRWKSREAFVADVLVETVRRTSLIPETEEDVSRLFGVIGRYRDDFLTAQGRRNLVVESLRIAVDADIRRILASPRSRTFLSLSATFSGLPAGRVRTSVGDALVAAQEGFVQRREEVYASLAQLIGYRLVGEGSYTVMSEAAGAMMNGLVLRAIADPGWLDRRQESALFGASDAAEWSAPERLLVGLMLSHLEPDPAVEWTPAAVERQVAEFEQRVAELFAGTNAERP